MKKISDTELKAIIYKHAKWLRGEDGGECADLRGANLRGADLRDAKVDEVKWNMYTTFYPLQCPETGSLLGKKRKLTAWITTCWGNEVE